MKNIKTYEGFKDIFKSNTKKKYRSAFGLPPTGTSPDEGEWKDAVDDNSGDETEYNKFLGLDISEIESVTFFWTNSPHFTDFKDIHGNYCDPDLRSEMNRLISDKLDGILPTDFRKILEDNGLVIVGDSEYHTSLSGEDLVTFFDIIQKF